MNERRRYLLREFELTALRLLFPNASPKKIRRLYELAKEKHVTICRPPVHSEALDNIMGSIIRHSGTHYEEVLRAGLARENARGLVQPIIHRELEAMRGEK